MNKGKSKTYYDMFNRLNAAGMAERFRTFKAGPGVIDVFQVDQKTNEVCYCPIEEVVNEIISFAHNSKNCDLGPKDCLSMANWWVVMNQEKKGLKKIPKAIAEKSDKSLTFRRLPFDYQPSEKQKPPLHFLEFCNRVSDPDILQAFIGSIFVEESYRQQYLYIFGGGGDGKGTLFNFLQRMMGQTYIAEDVPSRDAKFWASNLQGKRLCVFPDLEDPRFPSSALFKKITGGDLLRLEEKYKQASYAYINTKFMMGGNDELAVTRRRADLRRALYLTVEEFKGAPDPLYLQKLWGEASAIYALCLEKYRSLCPKNGPIVQDFAQKDVVAFAYELETDRFFNTYFEPSPAGEITGSQWQAAKTDYFGRKPTKEEEAIFNQELNARGYKKVRTSKGWVIKGLRTKSSLTLMNERAHEVSKRAEWPHV